MTVKNINDQILNTMDWLNNGFQEDHKCDLRRSGMRLIGICDGLYGYHGYTL